MNRIRAGSLLFLFAGIYGFALSIELPMGKLKQPGPGVFPLVISILLIVLGGLIFVSGKKQEKIELTGGLKELWRPLSIVLLTVAFIIALERVGYLITSCLYLLGLFWFASGLKWWVAAVLSGTLALASWYLFGKILGVHLPMGYWRLLP